MHSFCDQPISRRQPIMCRRLLYRQLQVVDCQCWNVTLHYYAGCRIHFLLPAKWPTQYPTLHVNSWRRRLYIWKILRAVDKGRFAILPSQKQEPYTMGGEFSVCGRKPCDDPIVPLQWPFQHVVRVTCHSLRLLVYCSRRNNANHSLLCPRGTTHRNPKYSCWSTATKKYHSIN